MNNEISRPRKIHVAETAAMQAMSIAKVIRILRVLLKVRIPARRSYRYALFCRIY